MKEIYNDEKWIGQKFGRLTVVSASYLPSGENHAWYWNCKCDCGKMVYGIRPRNLKNGNTKSCGCLQDEIKKEKFIGCKRTHGKSNTRLYGIWEKMKDRCERERCPAYKNYGGRGIKVCEEWHDFQTFYDWAMANGYQENLTIERINNDKGYYPDNCCWITREEQAKNKRNIRYVEMDGEKIPLKTACERFGVPYKAVHLRVTRYGMSIEEALNKPFKNIANYGARKAKENGIGYQTYLCRIKSGWTEEAACTIPVGATRNRQYSKRMEEPTNVSPQENP